ncbi:hypothetical protein [Pediococcus acidilactici]|uniref:hypothetical protein n=1 Tax=Pediococcus acidilactici TaxID=1254 RepID=UPI0018970456|nr:hypothetical protein [Pediococcus acidilactici]
MDKDKIVYVEEFYDDSAKKRTNEMLGKGWTLLNVGTKMVDYSIENGQADYEPCYVVGASQEQYDHYKQELEERPSIHDILTEKGDF